MSALSIRSKIWVSFSVLLLLLLTVGIITFHNLRNNEQKLVKLVNEVQPTATLSLHLIDQLDRASASLGFYLLSKEEVHKNDYIVYLTKIHESTAKLKNMPLIQRDVKMRELAGTVEAKIAKLESYKDRMLELAANEGMNVPGIQFANENVNPLVQGLLQQIQQILLAEEGEKATKARKQFLFEISELRHTLVSAVNALRLYLAFRSEDQITNFRTFGETLNEQLKKVNNYDQDFLTFEQYEALQEFNQGFQKYFVNADRLMQIHRAEDWRQDAYIIRKEISPLLLEIQEILNASVEDLQATSVKDSRSLTDQVNRTMVIVATLLGIGFMAAMMIGLLLSRAINNPIAALKESATQLAQGHLDQHIDVSRKDELGSLARRFAAMRDSIKKKIEDLRVLNHTGEELAGMRTGLDVLQTSLRVMGNQTNVEWGSVYLLNKETQMLEIKAYFPHRDIETHSQAKSFRLGEGIAGRAAFKKQVIYIPDTSKEEDFVNNNNNEEPKAIICVPLVDNDEIFGVMNFSGKVDRVRFEKSDAEFAETIARMTVVSSKNIQMVSLIEEHNRTLEQKIQERTAELRGKTNDINNMLQNMHQGIFTITADNKIHPEYSAYLETILETKDIAGRDIMDLLFAGTNLSNNDIDQVRAALGAIVGEDELMFQCNSHCLVSEFNKTLVNGKIKILELSWAPIAGDGGTVDKLMITVRDVTELRGLQAEAEQQKWELEVIGQILSVSQNKFQSFIKNAYQFIDENEKFIKNTSNADPNVIATLFRNMHTIKGNARTYGLQFITEAVHEAENTYDKLRKQVTTEWNQEQLLQELLRSKQLIETYERIYRQKLAGSNPEGVFIDNELLKMAKDVLYKVHVDDNTSLKETVRRLQVIFDAIGTEPVQAIVDGIVKNIPEVAKQLGKPAPNVVVKGNQLRVNADVTPVLKNVFTHGFRNSVDHGLESPEERKQKGKPDQGTITLDVEQQGDKLVFRLFDDGRGLALERIKRKAIEAGFFKEYEDVTDEQIAEMIFHSGLSTSENVSDISGRGVGMDAVRRFVQKLGGDIEIRFTGAATQDSRFRPFESRITLPADIAVKVA